jgi:hypothetical protein
MAPTARRVPSNDFKLHSAAERAAKTRLVPPATAAAQISPIVSCVHARVHISFSGKEKKAAAHQKNKKLTPDAFCFSLFSPPLHGWCHTSPAAHL